MMAYQNLSTIGETYVIELDGEHGLEYWTGGTGWTQDLEQAQRFGTGKAQLFMAMLQNCGLKVRCKTVPGQYQFMQWPGIGWVVVNFSNEETTVHRVRIINGYGEGWFIKDHGTIEHTLCINRKADFFQDIVFRGQEIVSVFTTLNGERSDDIEAIIIPDDSNLRFMFEFESKPAVELEVA